MPRRVLLIIALITLAVLATAVVPWTLSGGGVAASVAQQLRKGYGIDLEVRGRSTIALLPVPRVKFENVELATADRSMTARGAILRGELRLLPLLVGRVDLSEVALAASQVTVDAEAARTLDLSQALASLKGRQGQVSHIRRLILTASSIQWSQAHGGALDGATLVINWPARDDRLDVYGQASWRGERVEVTGTAGKPLSLASGQTSPFSLTVKAPGGQVAFSGEAEIGSAPRITGQSLIEARSVRDFSRWSGLDLPLGSLMRAVTIEGDFSADRRRVSWPSVAMKLGTDRLDGTLSLRFENNRPMITGTLAAEQLDLSDFFVPFAQARTASGLWSGEEISVSSATGGDLDLRLSATDVRIGRLRFDEMAANVLVRPGRIEASLGRAGLHGGSIKGRLTLSALEGEETEVKAQGTFDRVSLAPFLSAVGQSRWINGQGQGQFALEGRANTVVDLVRRSHGRATINVKQGELIGIGLEDALRQVEKRPLAASLEWKGGRTAFDQVHANLSIAGGVGEITEGSLTAPTVRTLLQGRVSIIDRSIAMRAHVDAAGPGISPSPLIVFDVIGGWDDVAIIPDAKALIERSGAAKPLFGPERLTPASRGASAIPLSTPQ